MSNLAKKIVAGLILAFYLPACASNSHHIHSNDSSDYSFTSGEVSLGKQIHNYIISKMPVYENPQVNQYVQTIGKRLATFAKRKNLPYQFIILQDERIYATSAPGGFVYITTGFILFSENEAELAAVLAHEIGELQMKDPRFSRTKSIVEKVIAGGAMAAPLFGNLGVLAVLGVVGMYALINEEDAQEKRLLKADKTALYLLTDAGEDPQGLIDVCHKLLNASPRNLMYLYDYYQTRPVTESRIKKLESHFTSLPLQNKTFTTNRSYFLDMLKSLRFTSTT